MVQIPDERARKAVTTYLEINDPIAFWIGTRHSPVDLWGTTDRSLQVIAPHTVSDLAGVSQCALNTFRSRFGRDPLLGEIGCASAHREAYQRLLQAGSEWGVVIEDDAVIPSIPLLRQRIESICVWEFMRPTIVMLYADGFPLSPLLRRGPIPGTVRAPISPAGTVAYALNRSAARLLMAQELGASTADWPVQARHADFLLDLKRTVRHDEQSSSTVDQNCSRHDRGCLSQIADILGFRFWMKQTADLSAIDYYEWVMRPIVVHRCHSLIRKVGQLTSWGPK